MTANFLLTLVLTTPLSFYHNFQTFQKSNESIAIDEPKFTDVCTQQTTTSLQIECDGGIIKVVTAKKAWSKEIGGTNLKAFVLFDKYLITTSNVEGALSFLQTSIFNIQSGKLLMSNDGSIFYLDNKNKIALLVPTGTALGIEAYQPTIYKFNFAKEKLDIVTYELKPRVKCEGRYNEVTSSRSLKSVYVSGKLLIFPRADNCGPFNLTFSIPEN